MIETDVARMVELRRQGLTFRDIAREVGVSYMTVRSKLIAAGEVAPTQHRRTPTPIGLRSGKLIIVAEAPDREGVRWAFCRCDCGNELIVRLMSLTRKNTQSCGCLPLGINGKRWELAQACHEHGISPGVVRSRIGGGHSAEDALRYPPGKLPNDRRRKGAAR